MHGILLINLGTPDHCDLKSVRRYLREFLMDPYVIDIPFLPRFFLIQGLVIPLRAKRSTEAYQKIWSEAGSPLRFHAERLKIELQKNLSDTYQIEIGMRYGNPSIANALEKLKPCKTLSIFPLFPQYSTAATESAIQKALSLLPNKDQLASVQKSFFDDPGFIMAYAHNISVATQNIPIEHHLFSYHGLPERHIEKTGCTLCPAEQSCPAVKDTNANCYRAQCFSTSRLLATSLNLTPKQYTTCFQSRLGRTPWIKPYTDHVLKELIDRGIRSIAISCPSFVADCLETLEEVNIGLREQWLGLGGKELIFVPSLNSEPLWIKALTNLIEKSAPSNAT